MKKVLVISLLGASLSGCVGLHDADVRQKMAYQQGIHDGMLLGAGAPGLCPKPATKEGGPL